MRPTIFAAAVFGSLSFANAASFDDAQTIQVFFSLDRECRMMETDAGAQLTSIQSKAACVRLKEVTAELKDHGYCWDKSEFGWTKPGDTDTTGVLCPAK